MCRSRAGAVVTALGFRPTVTLSTAGRTSSPASCECVFRHRRLRLGPRGVLVVNVSLLLCPQVPPLQEQESSRLRAGELQGQDTVLGQGTPDHRPFPGGPWQRHKNHRTEQVLEWLFISQEQPKTTQSRVSCLLIYSCFSLVLSRSV